MRFKAWPVCCAPVCSKAQFLLSPLWAHVCLTQVCVLICCVIMIVKCAINHERSLGQNIMFKSKHSYRVGNGACIEKMRWRWGTIEKEELAETPSVWSVKGHCQTWAVTCIDLLHTQDGVWQHLYVHTAGRMQVNVEKQPDCRNQSGLLVTFRINGKGPLQAPIGFTV